MVIRSNWMCPTTLFVCDISNTVSGYRFSSADIWLNTAESTNSLPFPQPPKKHAHFDSDVRVFFRCFTNISWLTRCILACLWKSIRSHLFKLVFFYTFKLVTTQSQNILMLTQIFRLLFHLLWNEILISIRFPTYDQEISTVHCATAVVMMQIWAFFCVDEMRCIAFQSHLFKRSSKHSRAFSWLFPIWL